MEILGHLQSDEPDADHHSGTGALGSLDGGVSIDDIRDTCARFTSGADGTTASSPMLKTR
ncbi:hypothetical protein [Pseudonocardia alni]|uniref:Uncharacterized protein n=1 Tax=Pseudonocardia alni TaxID=33907 RepID=A0A852W9X1_PSEA5|nr:hypothetical protein [Pseudonocardia antarctica]NYG04141.1 hypothetical protein [Pseudonocardia antarctica]